MTDRKLMDRAREMGLQVEDTQKLLEAIEGARQQLSVASDEMRMTTTVIRERLAWLIGEMDKLRAQIATWKPDAP